MHCHRDRRMTKPVARRPLRPTGVDGMGPASTSSWRLASSPMALVTRPYRLPPRAAKGPLKNNFTELASRFASDSVATD